MKKTGIFSGSFNPIHIGHLALANWLCEFEELDEIWFLITPQNPLKQSHDLMDDQLRLEMAQAAIGDYHKFKVSDFEFYLPKPTYTIHTLQALKEHYPGFLFHLIIGADNWSLFAQWKNYQDIIDNHPILVYPRKGFEINIPKMYSNVRAVNAPLIEVSSTFIRDSYKKGKDIRFFLPEEVRKYFVSS